MTERLSTSWFNDLHKTFAIPSYEEWEEVAKASLKGKSFEKLFTQTYEGITLNPVYRKNLLSKNVTIPNNRLNDTWDISQEIKVSTVGEAIDSIKKALQFGQTSINIDLTNLPINKDELYGLLDSFTQAKASFFFKGDTRFVGDVLSYQSEKGIRLNGVIGLDPIANWVKSGNLTRNLSSYYDEMAVNIKKVNESSSKVKTLVVDSLPVHNGGANAVQELAYTLSVAIEYVNELQERGLTIDEIAPHFSFSFSVGSNMFMEIAKLRAAKFLWTSIIKEFGGSVESQNIWIHTRTSSTTKTKYDPYVNMLRATVETFAAVVGGANSVHTSTFDEAYGVSTDFSERIARNVQSILKEESHLNRVLDPAGGSWYIESITTELAEKVWEAIQHIEQDGGIVATLKSGTIQEEIKETSEKRFNHIDYRKERIVGTNMYANIMEQQLESAKEENSTLGNKDQFSVDTIQAIPPVRWSMKFEELRDTTISYFNKYGKKLSVQLVNVGELAKHKPRTDFIKGFFEVGGFEVKNSPSFTTLDEINSFLTTSTETVYVLCGQDETYEEIGKDIVNLLHSHSPSSMIYIAGRLETQAKEEYKQLGLTDMIHMNSNCYEFLSKLQKEMGGYHEKA